jgi:hypothetical protein
VVSPGDVKYRSSSSVDVTGPGRKGVGTLTASSPDLAIPAGGTLKGNISFTVNATNQVSRLSKHPFSWEIVLSLGYRRKGCKVNDSWPVQVTRAATQHRTGT